MTKHPIIAAIALLALTSNASAQWYQGPSGGSGGSPFDSWEESGHATDISSVGVIDDGTIRCISIGYRGTPANPGRWTAFWHGTCLYGAGEIGFEHSCSMLLDADEYLLGVEGTYDDHISSLRFYTSKRTTQSCKTNPQHPNVWGTRGSRSFGYTAPSGQMIVALIGRAGESVDAIGVMYAPCPPATKQCK